MNNQMNEEVEQVELEMIENEYWVKKAEDLAWLEKNKQFQNVILEGYFKDRALDAVSLLGTDHIKNNGKRPEVMEQLVAISTLQDHFMTIKQMGGIAADDISNAVEAEEE